MAYLIVLRNSGGELDRRKVASQDQAKTAAIDILEEIDHLSDGDTLVVREIPD